MHSVPRAERLPNILFGLLFLILGIVSTIWTLTHGGATNVFDDVGLILLGIALLVLKQLRIRRALKLLFIGITLAVLVNLGVLNGRLVVFLSATLVSFYLFYKFVKITFGRRPKPKMIAPEQTPAADQFITADDHYLPYVSSQAYLTRDVAHSLIQKVVGPSYCPGLRTQLGPFAIDHFVSDREPPAGKDGPLRLVLWQPIHEPTAEGWRVLKTHQFLQMTGFTRLDPGKPYIDGWSAHARRHLNRWNHQTEWEIVHPSLSAFIASYQKSNKPILLKLLYIRSLRKLERRQPGHVLSWAVKRRGVENAPLEAGFVALDVPEAKTMQHFISFIHPAAKDSGAGVGLMYAWFAKATELGREVLDFGTFWYPGDPEPWKGFSRFKSQFAITYVRYPHQRLRLAGKLFS